MDPELHFPERAEPECDVVYCGKWAPYRDALAARVCPRTHACSGKTR